MTDGPELTSSHQPGLIQATEAIASRAFGGLFNPNVGLVQTCTGELASEEQRRE